MGRGSTTYTLESFIADSKTNSGADGDRVEASLARLEELERVSRAVLALPLVSGELVWLRRGIGISTPRKAILDLHLALGGKP